MGKITLRGSVPPDDPMFNGRIEFFRKMESHPPDPPRQATAAVRRVSINWAGDQLFLDLDSDSWDRVQAGKELTIEELDEDDEISYRWLFNAEPGHSLIVDFGDPNHLRWLGQLADAEITEIKGE